MKWTTILSTLALFAVETQGAQIATDDDAILQQQLELVRQKIAALEAHIPSLEQKIQGLEVVVEENEYIIEELESRRQLQAACAFQSAVDLDTSEVTCTLTSPLAVQGSTTSVATSAVFGNASATGDLLPGGLPPPLIARGGNLRRKLKISTTSSSSSSTSSDDRDGSEDEGQRDVDIGNPFATSLTGKHKLVVTGPSMKTLAHTAVNGHGSIYNELNVEGMVWVGDLYVEGDEFLVEGDTVIDGNGTISGDVIVDGEMVVEGRTQVSGVATFEGDTTVIELDVDDESGEISIEIEGNLDVSGDAEFNFDVVMDELEVEDLNVTTGNLTCDGSC